MPPGAPPDAYGRLVEIAHAAGARAVVDAAGSTLLRALDAAPDLVTPNLAEAEGSLGLGGEGASVASGPDARPRALAAAEALLRQGARAAVVTADAAGAAVCLDGAGEWVPAPRVAEVRNPIGAGDVLLSALAGALERGRGAGGGRARGGGGGLGERRAPDGRDARSGAGAGLAAGCAGERRALRRVRGAAAARCV